MGIEDLIVIANELDPVELADVIDLATYYRARHGEHDEMKATLERVAADPAALTRLEALIQVGRDAVARGEVVDGPSAIAGLRAKYGLDASQA